MSAPGANRILGEIEGPRPLRAIAGRVALKGWCLLSGESAAPPVRLLTNAGTLLAVSGLARSDVSALLPAQPAAGRSGFVIEGWLPEGIYSARFDAQLPDGTWQRFRELSLAVEARPFAADIESPASTGTIRTRVHVEGWALDPRQRTDALVLRYGHQEIPCDLGRPRQDLGASYPDSPQAPEAGFKSRTILSAGRGPLRLKARLADGTTALARSLLLVDIATDENHDAGIDFGATRVPLPVVRANAPLHRVADHPSRPLNILFILPGSFASNSALHVAALANELAAAGHACVVAVSHDLSTLAHHQTPAFRGVLHSAADTDTIFAGGRGPDVIHAWTTRENVRRLTESLRSRHSARVIVHLEDHEQEILALSLGRPTAELEKLSVEELDRLIPADLSHPRRSREFLARADAVTVIIDRLREFVPSGRPCHTIWPAADARFFHPQPRPETFRRLLDRTADETVLFYHGNVHAANAAEMRELYLAVLELNRRGQPVTLIRTGIDSVDFLGSVADMVAPHVLSLGQILHHHHLPPLMALADIFVQPGAPGPFNDYRFPSKLPEFFSFGRPVILPRTNLGTLVRAGVDAYVLDRGDATEIAAAVNELRGNRELCERLGQGASAFAARHFSWQRSAEQLAEFYQNVVLRSS